jgi:3-oxoacyl-[acyl-carrier protein] reductase
VEGLFPLWAATRTHHTTKKKGESVKKENELLCGKSALVTGASRGLGREIALALGRAGADVAVSDLLIEDENDGADTETYGVLAAHFSGTGNVRTRSTADEICRMGVRSIGVRLDVTDTESIRGAVAKIQDQFGRIDILVNNAGVMDNMALMEKQTDRMWERDIGVNLTGTYNCIKAVWAYMKKEKWGRIINISSFVGLSGAFAQPGYGASKAGIIGLTRSLALEGATDHITVNAVLPGFIETEALMLHQPEMLERIKRRIAMRRLGRTEEVAAAAVFLASEGAGYITGAVIPVTGGADLFVF